MNGRTLIPCAACARHVRNDEQTCPFCGAERVAAPVSRLRSLPRGSSRAAAFALRAALMTATAGCAASHDPDDEPGATPSQVGAGATDAGSTRDAQAVPDARSADAAQHVVADAARDAAPSAASDAAPSPVLEASVSDAATPAHADAWVPIPIYGGVFPDPRTRAKV